MSLFSSWGLRPVINASGTLTRLGGSRMAPEVLQAMCDAAAEFVPIGELQARAGALIAEITGAEAGYVVNGAAAGLTLGTAACVAGMDVWKMDRLPDTTGMKCEVIVQRGHRNAYDHAIRAVGVTLVEVGYLGYPGAGGTLPWQIERAINERTAAIACPVIDTPGTVALPAVCEIAHRHGIPVIVDAAAELPPRSNLQRFIAEGADLVVFSGGKAICGPQASGVIAGRRDLIASIALQHQDMDVRPETWSARDAIDDGRLSGIPHQGIGRAMKVGREEIAGLMVALQRFADGDDDEDRRLWAERLDVVEAAFGEVAGVTKARAGLSDKKVPKLLLTLDPAVVGLRAFDAVNRLLDGHPRVAVDESRGEFEMIIVNPQQVTMDEAAVVGQRLRDVLGGAGRT